MDAHETKIYFIVMITALVLGLLIAYFTIIVFWKHRRYFEIQRRHLLQEIDLLEADRNRIAKDLHDELGPVLSLALMQVGKAAAKNDLIDPLLEQAEQNIKRVVDRMGDITRNLSPRMLHHKGMKAALQHFVGQVQEVNAIVTDLHYSVDEEPSPDTAIQLYRIVQELVNNAIRHAHASYLLLRFRKRKSVLYFQYRDNGLGIKQTASEPGLGLASIRNRVQLLGGKMQRSSGHDNGTEYFFEIPLN